MKKTMHKAFTLVELIIVVVIIGILAAALLPRLQGAQGSARDAARKSDISQLGSAIVTYQANRGYYPLASGDNSAATQKVVSAEDLRDDLSTVADLSSMPTDPLKGNIFTGLNNGETDNGLEQITGGQYAYSVHPKNGVPRGGFVVMARTETEGGSNWVHVSTSGNLADQDITEFKPCTTIIQGDEKDAPGTNDGKGECTYGNKSQLRYIYLF